ncbi:MAG TPA: hypothetical protein DCZ01_11080 [Elusimicrobia bacterium]|nr:MAG: hypothetical protein A2X37_02070 [Elusimicrobia bacterium GWA2_66_18]OGR68414.1 MAG: hypothetical protein A2X40_09835 [Elusimicrobia bacterium GWC2_65_9]HAZ09034.1 hypothetical protein [Elusimicrobiota bacterium]
MKIPPAPLTALSLAILLAGAARASRTPDGREIIDDSYMGPLRPDQCRASQCASTPSDPVTESALLAVGRRQRAESGLIAGDPDVIAFENRMKADGTLKDLIRRPDGAIYVFPDGKVSWSDYVSQNNTVPWDPTACAGNPGCPAQLKTYLDKQAQADKEKKDTAARDKNMFQANMFSPDTDADKSKSPPPAQDPSADPDADGFSLGEALGGDQNLFAGNQGDQSSEAAASVEGVNEAGTDRPAGDFTYLRLRQVSEKTNSLRSLDPAAASRFFDGKTAERGSLDEKDPARWKTETNR